jgi:hypothetical protein
MVAYRLSAQVIGRSTGRSATGAAAYRAACRIEDERTGLTRDYTRKSGVLHTEILAPENAPDWMRDRAKLWNAIEAVEKRKDAQLCREILLNLPHELTREQQIELVREFVRDQCVALGMIADLAVHAPHRKGDDRNTHAHVMLSMRELTPDGFGPKVRDWNNPELLEQWREQWALCQNRALERAGRAERVDHRSLEAQGIDREPEPKQGPVATQMEREGRPSKAGDDRRAAKERNEQRAELKAEAKIIDFEIARIEREERERQQDRQPPPPKMPPAVIYRQKARFETWANARRADLQNRRLGAEGEQGRGHDRQRLKLGRQQESAYGQQLQTLNAEAAAITARQRQGRGLRGLAYRITGRAERDRQRADEVRAGIANIEQRKAEQHQALNAEQQADRAALAARYVGRAAQLEQRIEQRRAEREAEEWTPPEAREATTGQEIDREAENSPVEGREAGTGETTPENEPAPTASPEAAQEGDSGQGQEQKPKTGWASEEERNAAIRAEYERREAQEREERERGSNDNDRGREME